MPAVRIEITPRALNFASLGAPLLLSVTAYNRNGAVVPGLPVTIISENAAVVRVTGFPAAVAESNGTTRIIAAHGDLRDAIPVTVRQVIASLAVEPPGGFDMTVGGTARFTIRPLDANGHFVADPGRHLGEAAVPGLPAWTERLTVGAGFGHACVSDDEGRTLCWGRWPDSDASRTPVAVGGPRLEKMDGGNQFSCGLTSSGAAYCWGSNGAGQLGNGSKTASSTPVAVSGGREFTALAVGGYFAYGLTRDGRAFCWGAGGDGTIGNGQWEDASPPQPVSGGHGFTSIAAGSHHACGLIADGTAYCWGYNRSGEVGVTPERCVRPGGTIIGNGCHNEPVQVSVNDRFKALALGGETSCGLASDGNARCWGQQSGRFPPPGGETFATIVAGYNTFCLTTASGQPLCWGSNTWPVRERNFEYILELNDRRAAWGEVQPGGDREQPRVRHRVGRLRLLLGPRRAGPSERPVAVPAASNRSLMITREKGQERTAPGPVLVCASAGSPSGVNNKRPHHGVPHVLRTYRPVRSAQLRGMGAAGIVEVGRVYRRPSAGLFWNSHQEASMLVRTFLSLPLTALVLAACDSPSDSRHPGPPAKLEILAGDQQQDTVGQELPQILVVRVTDERGRPVPDQIVNFRVTAGNGSVFAGAATTNRDGEARERWTLGTVAGDTQRVEARAVDNTSGAELVFGSFWAIGKPGAPASIANKSAGGGPQAPPEMNISPAAVVRVADQYGNGVPGVSVSWAVSSGGGTVSAASTQTDASGLATVAWFLGPTAAPQTLTATVAGLAPVQFQASLLLPASVALISGPNSVAGGTSTEYAFQVRDAYNQPLPNTAVEWTFQTPGGATLTALSMKSDAGGVVRARLAVSSVQATHQISVRAGTATSALSVAVTGPITLTNVAGQGTQGITDVPAYVNAHVTSSAAAITSVRANFADREVVLSKGSGDGWWSTLDMSGVPGGRYAGTVTAIDAAGNSAVATFVLVHDPNAVVTIVTPADSVVTAKGSIRVRATCSWQAGSQPAADCGALYSSMGMSIHSETGTNSVNILPSALGRTEMDAEVQLPAGPATVSIGVMWTDRQGRRYQATDQIVVNVQP